MAACVQLHQAEINIRLLLLTILAVISSVRCVPVQVISGARYEPLRGTVFYESAIPVAYEAPFDSNLDHPIPRPNLIPGRCVGKSKIVDSFCTQRSHMQTLRDNIHTLLKVEQESIDSRRAVLGKRSVRGLQPLGSAIQWCCNVALMDNVHDLVENEVVTNSKLNGLLDFVHDDHKQFVLTTQKLNNFSASVNNVVQEVQKTLHRLGNQLSINVNDTNEVIEQKILGYVQESWMYTYLQLYFSNLASIEGSCKSNKIPREVVSSGVLLRDLKILESKIGSLNLTLALPVDHLNVYYRLPICKCSFAQGKIAVHIQVPVIKRSTRYVAYEYHAIPFMWNNKICKFASKEIVVVKVNETLKVVGSDARTNCRFKETGMCLVPRVTADVSPAARCAQVLLNEVDMVKLREHCQFHCEDMGSAVLVDQVSVNKFIITNMMSDMSISCVNETRNSWVSRVEVGAVELTLPCDCVLKEGEKVVVDRVVPCDVRDVVEPRHVHVLPLSWTNLRDLQIDPLDQMERIEFKSIDGFVNNMWNVTVPTFEVSTLEKVKLFEHVEVPNSWLDIISDRGLLLYAVLVWSGVLTVVTAIALYLVHVLYIKLDLLTKPPALPPRTNV